MKFTERQKNVLKILATPTSEFVDLDELISRMQPETTKQAIQHVLRRMCVQEYVKREVRKTSKMIGDKEFIRPRCILTLTEKGLDAAYHFAADSK